MSYLGIVRKGVIVLDGDAQLPEGTAVEVRPVATDGNSLLQHPARGVWHDRSDMSDPAEASLRLRKQLEARGSDA